jgi:hypothetical protein
MYIISPKSFDNIKQLNISSLEIDYELKVISVSFSDGEQLVCELVVRPYIDQRTGEWSAFGVRSDIDSDESVYITPLLQTQIIYIGKEILNKLLIDMQETGDADLVWPQN